MVQKVGHQRAWEPEAIEWLQEHATKMRFAKLVERYKEAALQNGWKARTISGLRIKLSKLGLGAIKPVICLDTGEVYPSAKNAAKAVGVKTVSIYNSICRSTNCAGYRWAYLDELEMSA